MEKIRGICLDKEKKLNLIKFDKPKVKKGFALVKIKKAGICATDLGYVKFGGKNLNLPVILGHEASGIIEDIGEDIVNLKKGDRVILTNDFYVCGKCKYCLNGDTNMCSERRSLGSKENGALCEYVLAPENIILPIPDNISFEEGALIEVLACGVHALTKQTKINPGDTVLISGPGSIGATAAFAAKAMGANVLVAGLNNDINRFEIIKSLGIEKIINIEKENLNEIIKNETNGYGADISIEAAGNWKSLESCIENTRKKGYIAQMGVLHGKCEADISKILTKELHYVGCYAKTNEAWKIAIDLVSSGKVKLKELISDVMRLEDFEEAFIKAEKCSGFKILFDPEL